MNQQLRMITDPDWASERACLDAKAHGDPKRSKSRQRVCAVAVSASNSSTSNSPTTALRSRAWAKQFELSEHAHLRTQQRGLRKCDIRYVLRYGSRHHAANAVIYYLRRVDIPAEHLQRVARLEGTAVFTAQDRPCVITVWRNRLHGTRNLHRKLCQIWHCSGTR